MGFQDAGQNMASANPDAVALNKEHDDEENADGGDGICWIS